MKYIVALILLLLATSTFAQTDLELADASYANRDYTAAAAMYQKILSRKAQPKDVGEIKFRVAESFRYTGQYDKAIEWYDQAKASGYTNPNYLYHIAGILIKQGKYEEAKKRLNDFLALQPNDKDATRLLNNCNFALGATEEKTIYTVKNEQPLNTTYSEYGTVQVKDKLLFTSSRIEAKGENVYSFDGQGFSDVYQSTYVKENKSWNKAEKVAALNSAFNDGPFTYCEKTKTIYVTKCNDGKGKSNLCTIVESTFNENTNSWSAPQTIKTTFVPQADMVQPAISQSGDRLYFVSKMEKGIGSNDLWVMKKNGDQWGEPQNIGTGVNTEFDEMFPVVYNDSILYFSSDGLAGYGGLDLFYTVNSGGNWSKPINLKAPFNSNADDFAIIYNSDKSNGYFTSNRPGGSGFDDIYNFFITPITLTVKGKVTDVDGNKPLAGAQVILTTNDGTDTAYTNANGEYTFNLDKDKDYKINVTNPGYFGDSRKLTTQGEQFSKEFSKATGHNYDFSIKKIPKTEIKIDNIYYDYNSYTLREESKPSLDQLVKLLEDTPDALVQINSHTDERGKNDYNQKLSENRAKSVVEYLVGKGINPTRLTAKGFGFNQPVVKGAKTEEEHQMNRRTAFQVMNNQ